MKIRFKKSVVTPLKQAPFLIIDVGGRGGLKSEWLPLRPYLRCIGFEPDPDEFDRLDKEYSVDSEVTYYSTALWDSKKELTLHVTQKEGLSSVRLPNQKFLKHYGPKNVEGYQVEKVVTIPAARLDDVLSPEQSGQTDFVKVDVEGGAFEILTGAQNLFREGLVLGLRIEAEFSPKYTDQHLHSDVDQILRKLGYELFDFKICRWKRKSGLQTGGSEGQPVHGDFVYFLNSETFFEKVAPLPSEEKASKVIKYIVFLCLYGIYDAAFEMVEEASQRGFLSETQVLELTQELRKSQGILVRVPKLKGRGLVSNLLYHAFMLTFGVWLEYFGFWVPHVELEPA